MHLISPYAASHAFTGPEVWGGLQLPHLQSLLGQLQRQQVWQDPEQTPLHLPHERLQAQALGWDSDAAALPWAAWQSGAADGTPQAWITPCHWQIGMDQVVMGDPEALRLTAEESQQLLQAMQPYLIEDGLQVTWHSAHRWHARGALLAGLVSASLDRVIHQNVKDWMPQGPGARPLQRLQSEMQMLVYNHPVNDAREARRQITVNSFWLHGAGALPTPTGLRPTAPETEPNQRLKMHQDLRSAALHGDVKAWQKAWQQLDATVLAELLAHFKTTGQATLSLCSEHAAHTYATMPAAWHQRITRVFKKTTPAAALAALISL